MKPLSCRYSQLLAFLLLCCTIAGMRAQENTPILPPQPGEGWDTIPGKIDDEFSVTPAGQVAYEIPIKVPSGVGGMEPKLSIAYNGSPRNGLCGVGFDLTGLSVINRAPANLYNDGRVGTVEVSIGDCLMLDGQRLIKVANLEGGRTEYRTERNSFARIVSEESDSLGPVRFIVQTKSGLTCEYDTTGSPKANRYDPDGTAKTHFLFWLVKKVWDSSGNFYTVEYDTSPSGDEYWPVRINYTGHSTLKPDISSNPPHSVQFTYVQAPDSSTHFVAGLRVRRSRILNKVAVYTGGQEVRSYSLLYWSNGGHRYLKSVTESCPSSETRKRPTTFTWNVDNAYTHADEFNDVAVRQSIIVTGDYNGDGYTDICVLPGTQESQSTTWNGWQLYCGGGGTDRRQVLLENQGVFSQSALPTEAISGDFNGDGLDDLVVKLTIDQKHRCDLYLADTTRILTYLEPTRVIASLDDDYTMHKVEANGDGIADLLLCVKGQKNTQLFMGSPNEPLTASRSFTISGMDWTHNKVATGDFNGDGLTDVLNYSSSGSWVYIARGDSTFSERQTGLYSFLFDSYDAAIRIGDFNGDGKSDILSIYKNYGTYYYYMVYAVGNGFYCLPQRPLTLEDGYNVYPADVNGDGLDDLMLFKHHSVENASNAVFYVNNGNGQSFTPYSFGICDGDDKRRYYPGDYNGDGRVDVLSASNGVGSDWSGFWTHISLGGSRNVLASRTDGLGAVTSIDYKPMTDPAVHTAGVTIAGSVRSFTAPWPLVWRVTTGDGIGGVCTTSYHYTNALLHRLGRGVLGFETVTVTDDDTHTTTVTEYVLNTQAMVMAEQATRTTVNGHLVEETEIETAVTTYNNNSQVFTIDPVETITRKYEYNAPGGLVSETTVTQQLDQHGNVTRMTTATDTRVVTNVNTYTDDEQLWHLGRLTRSATTQTNATDSVTRVSEFEYSPATGLLVGESVEPADLTHGWHKTYTRDARGNITLSVVTPVNPDGAAQSRTTVTEWDTAGEHIIATVNAIGHRDSIWWNTQLGLPAGKRDANGQVTQFQYDAFGNTGRVSSPLDTTTIFRFRASVNTGAPAHAAMLTQTMSLGKPTVTVYTDTLGRTIRTITQGMDGREIYSDVEYNHLGQVARQSDPYFMGDPMQWHTFTYDAVGRTTLATAPDGTSVTTAYNGLTTTVTDQLGRHTWRTTDGEGRLVETQDDAGTLVQYDYDAAGNCVRVAGPRTETTAVFDKFGRRTRLADPDMGTATFSYDTFGQLVSQTTNGQTATYTYDKLGRIVTESRTDMSVQHTYDTQWKGALTSSTFTGAHSVEYTYDAKGRVIRETVTIGTREFNTQFTYNSLNQLAYVTYPNGSYVQNMYTATGYLWRVKHPGHGKVYWQADSMNARGQFERSTLGNGLTVRTAHDALTGRVAGITTPGITQWQYTFNETGCLTTRRDALRNKSEHFAYDNLNRLVAVHHGDSLAQAMTYDAAGNITSKTGVAEVVEYHAGTNRIKRLYGASYNPIPWDTITYTSFGKVSHIASGADSLDLVYGVGQSRVLARTWRSGTVVAERYYVNRYYELEVRGATLRPTCYIYGADGAVAFCESNGSPVSPVYYLHKDHLGSVIAYTDKDGHLTQELSYDVWGRRRDAGTWRYLDALTDAHALNPRGFTGHEHIDLMELVNMDGRVYDPVLGRFLSPDPYVQAPDMSQSLNRYAYCMNCPLSLCDPSGYSWFSRHWKGLLSSIVGVGVAVLTGGMVPGFIGAVVGGTLGGASAALLGAVLNGSNLWQIAKATVTGGWLGAVSGVLNYAAGSGNFIQKLLKHVFVEIELTGVQGGDVLHGALMGLTCFAAGESVVGLGKRWGAGLGVKALQTGIVAVAGGTVAELGGGNFANGAMTAAFAFLFNHLRHNQTRKYHVVAAQVPHDEMGTMAAVSLYSEVVLDQSYTKELCLSLSGCTNKPVVADGFMSAAMKAVLYLDGIESQTAFFQLSQNGELHSSQRMPMGMATFKSISPEKYKSIEVRVTTAWKYVIPNVGSYVPHIFGTHLLVGIPAFNLIKFRIK